MNFVNVNSANNQPGSIIDGLFAGGLAYLDEGHRTGIFKERIVGRVHVSRDGIAGDEHGDTRVHGGPEKAVHHYAAENYAQLAEAFPHSAAALVPGSIGENISAAGMSERNVHIGDIFRVGQTILQVSQPRSPCWKINHRFDAERMSIHVAQNMITGWYYRVLEPGSVCEGDSIALLERQTDRFSIRRFWEVQLARRPAVDDLLALASVDGLAMDWKLRMRERVRWQQGQPGVTC